MADNINKSSGKLKFKGLKPANWFKRNKSASPSASLSNSSRIPVASTSGAHGHGLGNDAGSAESTVPGDNGTLHQDPTVPFQSSRPPSSIRDLAGSVMDAGHGSENTRTSTAIIQPASTNSPMKDPDWKMTAKEGLGVASRFTQTLIKRVPECIDGNPVKMAFSIAKAIIDITNAVGDNKDELELRLEETAKRLLAVEATVVDGIPKAAEHAVESFKRILGEEMEKLKALSGPLLVQILDHEDYKKRLQQILQRVKDATTSFLVEIAISIQNTTTSIQNTTTSIQNTTTSIQNTATNIQNTTSRLQDDTKKAALERLHPSKRADHKTLLGEQDLKREKCTAGTRVKILEDITKWANDSSSQSERVFWLTGQAGSGKTTIAYTIAKSFDQANQRTVLGANFLCSRQFEETRQRTRIVPTLAYQLSRKCEPYADALHAADAFDAVNHDISTQLKELLIGPWQQSEATRNQVPPYLVVIDALDEIEGHGGSAFLQDLLTAVDEYDLRGIKFLVTSRSDPDIVALCKPFKSEAVLWLQDVPIEEAESDIGMYLKAKLPKLASSPELVELVRRTGGLFIYAATAVKHLTRSRSISRIEQAKMLRELLSNSYKSTSASKATFLIDELYRQIMYDTFSKFEGETLTRRLHILYTFLCTAERTSSSIVAELVVEGDDDAARAVAEDLHAVLYTQDNHIYWYHASFPDFIFDGDRSNFVLGGDKFEFSCNGPSHHHLLGESCFRVMSGLRFNMGDIESSFLFDADNADGLFEKVNKNISAVLRYSSRHWTHHLPSPESINTENLCRQISNFLEIRILFWMEALHLLGLSNRCTPMLQFAREWMLKCGMKYLELASDVGEAANFATYYIGSAAAQSTPHLYISALATWQRDTSLCRNWKGQFGRIPVFTHSRGRISMPLMTVQTRNGIFAVAFSSDNTRIVSGSRDKSVRVWDASTGAQLNILEGHTSWVNSVAFSSDNMRIVSGSHDSSVRVWDASTGAQLIILEGHTDCVNSVAFSSDSTRIVSGSHDSSVRLWDASTGAQLIILEGHTHWVNSVTFSSDNTRIVSGSHDLSVRVWDASTGAQLNILEGHTDCVKSVAFSSDNTRIVSGSDDESVRVWDASTGAQLNILEGHTDCVNSVTFSSDNTRIVSGSYDKSVRVWDASTGAQLNILEGHTSWVNSVAFSSDNTRIVSGSYDESVRVWDASTGAQLNILEGHTSCVNSVAFSSDNTRIVSGSDDKSVRVWDASTGAQLNILEGHTSWVYSVAFSSDNTRIVSGSRDNSVRVWDASTGEQLNILEGHTSWVDSVAFSSDNTRIVSGSHDSSVRVWDASTGAQLNILEGHTSWVDSVAFSSDNTRIVSGSHDSSVRVWDASTGAQLNILEGHTDCVNSVAFSSDNTRIVSGSHDSSVRVWDASTGAQLIILEGHTHSVNSVAFSSDNMRLVSGSHDSSVRVWDTSTGAELYVLRGHTNRVISVAFSSDNTQIVSGSYDESVRVWDISTGIDLSMMKGYTASDTLSNDGHFSWNLEETNWIISSPGRHHLMWVPPDARVSEPCNILTISRHGFGFVDFQKAMIGEEWVGCYTPH